MWKTGERQGCHVALFSKPIRMSGHSLLGRRCLDQQSGRQLWDGQAGLDRSSEKNASTQIQKLAHRHAHAEAGNARRGQRLHLSERSMSCPSNYWDNALQQLFQRRIGASRPLLDGAVSQQRRTFTMSGANGPRRT
ncbi:hypothetical protein LSCM4_06270 [Leishmania orientalis]|uniref:Uncharacterized protein n=1 Tax=Leishmania orientalis TaxID=2249476 RepID=A0A836I1U1_9TRYP|nr:hypothetical protein LSCM4_06270 [Leishmania orientalis]